MNPILNSTLNCGVAATLLAAGQSRRMGAFKPLLPFGERTVIEACIGNLSDAGVSEIIVVVGHRAAELRQRLAHLPVRFAVNDDPESEMGVSIARGVEMISHEAEAVLVALVDCPAVSAEVIRSITAQHHRTEKVESAAQARRLEVEAGSLIVPEWQGRGGHPVLIDLCYRESLLHLDPQRGLRAFFDRHRDQVRRVPVTSPYVLRDMDTWDAYEALHKQFFGVPPPIPAPSAASPPSPPR